MAKPNSHEVVLPVPRGDRAEVSEEINVWGDPARGGLDEAMIRDYIRTQEEHGKKEEQIQLDY
jgi:hypothetical protein